MNLVSSNVCRSFFVVVLVALESTAAPNRIGTNKEDECPAPPPTPRTSRADLALLRAVSWAFEPAPLEVRIQAIEDLGLMGDPRALNALAQICLDPNPALARAAVRAVGAIRHPRAEEILTNIIKHPGLPELTRTRALELLPFQNSWSSLRFIHSTASQPNPSAAVGQLAARLAGELPAPPGWVPPVVPPRGKR